MNLLLVHQAFVTPSEPGGTRHFEFGRFWVKQGHEIAVIASDRSYLSGQRVSGEEVLEVHEGVKVYRAQTPEGLHASYIQRIRAFLGFMLASYSIAKQITPVDIVLGTTPSLFQAVSAWAIARKKRAPFVLEIRDLWPEFAIDMGVLKNPGLIWLSRRLEEFLYRKANHFIVNSPAYKDYLISKGASVDTITLIPNGVDTSMFDIRQPEDEANLIEEWDLEGKFVAVYTGALGQANDIETILAAAEELKTKGPSVQILLVGDGKKRAELEEKAKGLSNVIFVGSVSKAVVSQYLTIADVCIATLLPIPMFTTTYPNKVFDYMAAGRPTVLAIDGVIRKVVEDAGGGIYVQPGDPQALAEALLFLKHNEAERIRLGKQAKHYVQENFERKDQAFLFCDLIAGLG